MNEHANWDDNSDLIEEEDLREEIISNGFTTFLELLHNDEYEKDTKMFYDVSDDAEELFFEAP